MARGVEDGIPAASRENESRMREVRFEHSREFPHILEHLRASLLVSTYQAGKLVVVGSHQGRLTFAFHNFDRVMGVAVSRQRIAVGTRRQVYLLHPSHEFAGRIPPLGIHDGCWLTRGSLVTGNVHGHEMGWGQEGLWLVNTLFSCLCTLEDGYSFVPRWRPPFISELAAEDRCHLNGLAMEEGRPRFATAHSDSNEPAGWRPNKATSGCVIDVVTGQLVARELCMPHSPRCFQDRLWALDSGKGRLIAIDRPNGHIQEVERFPGYARGLCFHGQFAFVGLSKIRETSVFGGVPIAEHRDELRCGVAAVDLVSGRTVAWLQFHSGVDEIFAVDVLPGCLHPVLSGPDPEQDGRQDIWVVPPEMPIAAARSATGSNEPPPPEASSAPPEGAGQMVAEASSLWRQGRLVEALEQFKRASTALPDRGDILTDLGNVYQELGDQDAALACYRRAVRVQHDCLPAHQNLGYLLFNYGEPDEAIAHYQEAQRLAPSGINRLLSATVLPVIYDSTDQLRRWRERYTAQVTRLAEEGVQIDTTRCMVPTSFFLAYQGENDRRLAQALGRIYQGVDLVAAGRTAAAVEGSRHTPCAAADGTRSVPATVLGVGGVSSRRVRVGFLSAYFRDHTIGRLNLGRVQHLTRDRFEVTVLYAGRREDEMTRAFARAADRFVAVPRDVAAARRQIADLGLNLLIFADVGMDALTSTLAFSRMAPIQCVTWGHPDTTGSPAMDYFISSELLETPEADGHYSERLVRLPNLGTYYYRPSLSGPDRSRESFGLESGRHVYLCPQTLFKFHPDFDTVLDGILAQDPLADLVLLQGRVPHWTAKLQQRLARSLGDRSSRVRFLPSQPNEAFLQLLSRADVVLDPFPYGGGNTSYEALAMGVPIVTWPSAYLRGRITLALYRKMGWTECVAGSAEEYVDLALRLANDRAYRQSACTTIQATSPALFEDLDEVHALEVFLQGLTVPRGGLASGA